MSAVEGKRSQSPPAEMLFQYGAQQCETPKSVQKGSGSANLSAERHLCKVQTNWCRGGLRKNQMPTFPKKSPGAALSQDRAPSNATSAASRFPMPKYQHNGCTDTLQSRRKPKLHEKIPTLQIILGYSSSHNFSLVIPISPKENQPRSLPRRAAGAGDQ